MSSRHVQTCRWQSEWLHLRFPVWERESFNFELDRAGDQPQDPEHDPGQVPLETAKGLAAALALRLLASKERSCRSMHAPLRDGDPMQGAVELTVALAVEAMTLLLARGSIERSDAGELRKLGVVWKTLDPGHLGHQLGG